MFFVKKPEFADSPHFVPEPFNWHLTPQATDTEKKEFAEFMNAIKEAHAGSRTSEE